MNEQSFSNLDLQANLVRGRRLTHHVWAHFKEDRCFEEAASLSYTSLLSMVPLLAVVFGIVSVFPVFEVWSNSLRDFIFRNFLPESGEQVVPYINTFLDSVSSLTLPGTVMLIVTALLLMVRIEAALNRIWRVDRNRSLTSRVVMYWAVLTLGPLLMAAAIALSAQKMFSETGFYSTLPTWMQGLGILFLTWLLFALFFTLVPNRRVRIRDALAGALLTTILFNLARAGFVAFVSNASYKVIYGALATMPIFLVWLYLVWIVILLGASLAASLTTYSDYSSRDSDWPGRWEFQLAFRLVGHLARMQREGGALSRSELMDLEPGASELQIVRLLSLLRTENVATRDEDSRWLLVRNAGSLTFGDLYRLGDYYLPVADAAQLPQDSPWDARFTTALEQIRQRGADAWDQPLQAMYVESAGGNDTTK